MGEDMDLPILAIELDLTPQAFAVCVPKTSSLLVWRPGGLAQLSVSA
jgi:hypothetical protein